MPSRPPLTGPIDDIPAADATSREERRVGSMRAFVTPIHADVSAAFRPSASRAIDCSRW